MNDINGKGIDLFRRAIKGEFKEENRFIERDYFMRGRFNDSYVFLCWSYSNKGTSYLYGVDKEDYKRDYHNAVFGDEEGMKKYFEGFPHFEEKGVEERRAAIRQWINKWGKENGHFKNGHAFIEVNGKRIVNCDQLQHLERLKSLNGLIGLDKGIEIEYYCEDYRDVPIGVGTKVIYCDIPYHGVTGYNINFDYDEFYEWAKRDNVFISEYDMPSDFKVLREFNKVVTLNANSKKKVKEKIFCSRSSHAVNLLTQ